jgi:hypothetical protein
MVSAFKCYCNHALPRIPVQLGDSGALFVALLNESRIRGRILLSVQEIRV